MTDVFELKREIRRIQLQRRLAKQRHEMAIAPLQQKLNEISTLLQKTTTGQRLNQHPIYQEVLEDVLGPCRETEEYRLLEASHMVEINQNLLELVVQQYRHFTDYMVCEINVMQGESRELKDSYLRRSSIVMEEMTRFTDSFGPLPNVQEHVEERRRSSCGGRRCSVSTTRRRTSLFTTKVSDMDDDSDDRSVMSDLSMSVASYISCGGAVKSMTGLLSDEQTFLTHDDYAEEHKHIQDVIPEEERFTVIKL